jgi:hypothetical protein
MFSYINIDRYKWHTHLLTNSVNVFLITDSRSSNEFGTIAPASAKAAFLD